jgi:hypothetical protein
MKVVDAVKFEDDLYKSTVMLRNWLHNPTIEQQKALHEAFGGVDKIHYGDLVNHLKNLLCASEMTHSKLSEVLTKTEIDI